ncbi:DUF7344 domain-containing protein [Halorubrum lipolyticum]|uniref:DUF7344 domain-containing protein n=1 Tax=Halorubrum lipolyticum TaxID=368624 RepID=UPI0011C9BA0F|nr:hypothetical protein [Halorubrum lipolyticum]
MYSDTQTVTTETLLRAVAAPERRAVLRHLHATDSRAVDVEDLAEVVESRGRSPDSEGVRTAIELHHTHLPVLADADVIEFDRSRGAVVYRGDDRTEALLEFVSERLE